MTEFSSNLQTRQDTPVSRVVAATNDNGTAAGLRARARAFAVPLLVDRAPNSGEGLLAHADAVADILASIGSSDAVQAAVYLSYASVALSKPEAVLESAFGADLARLAMESARLERLQERSRAASGGEALHDPEQATHQSEVVRKMLLAFSRDLRVVLLRLASRLQTLRYCASANQPVPIDILREARDVLAPLANRLGLWQIKWQMEDLVLRTEDPDIYRQVAHQLKQKRAEREAAIEQRRTDIQAGLKQAGLDARVAGRPKNISSIVRKMRGKGLDFEEVHDVRALRICVQTVADCYTALNWIHEQYTPVTDEYDDYIAKPKINGYQSLHTVVRDDAGLMWEVQIRTHQMHEHAESGVAAHWAYKEAGIKGYAGVNAASQYDAKIAALRQLLAWERDFSGAAPQHGLLDDRIYVLTPQAAVVELPAGATPVDFAYTVHTEVGHRCRGARVDGAMVPLNTPLKNGQTVEVTTAKTGGPSRDWLNPELGYLVSSRAKAKVRAWFNAERVHETIARGRAAVEKLLQKEGRTAVGLDQLASSLGFKSPEALFETVGKDELSLRSIALALHPETAGQPETPVPTAAPSAAPAAAGAIRVEDMDSLMAQPARCCKPAPPDAIAGYVTRGRGVSVHRADCPNFRSLSQRSPERVIQVSWSQPAGADRPRYPVDVLIRTLDRPGVLRDVTDVFMREKMSLVGVNTQTGRNVVKMVFTVRVDDTGRLQDVLRQVREVSGVRMAERI
ncbi:MAG: HD domain-containing protein [Ottowia sp.]|nr:HD domain-containing protein [Ottowia sp.]